MSIATYMGDTRLSDENFKAIFMTEWNARLDETAPLTRQIFLKGTDRYRVGESQMGVVTAPKGNENSLTKFYSPNPGKSVFITTDIFKFGMRATEEFADFGKGDYSQFPRHMVEVMDYTIKVMIFNMFNKAFDGAFPNAYDQKALCATDHVLADGVTEVANTLATASDLNEAALEAAVELLSNTPTEDGVFSMQFRPRLLLSRTSQWGNSRRLTESEYTTTVASSRGPNVPNIVGKLGLQSYAHPMFLSADNWFLLSQESPIAVLWSRLPELRGPAINQLEGDRSWLTKMQAAVAADTWRGLVGVEGS